MQNEEAWVRDARNGDHAAFANLVEQYQRGVFNLCLRMLGNPNDAEDAAQEAFLKSFKALGSYDPSRAFSTWLLSITAHLCIDRLRRKRVTQVSLEGLPPWRQLASGAVDPDGNAVRIDTGDRVRSSLGLISDEYRLVIVLRYWHDLGYMEIAELLGESESAVKSRLHRARRQLAELLADNGPHQPDLRETAATAAPAASSGGVVQCNHPSYAT